MKVSTCMAAWLAAAVLANCPQCLSAAERQKPGSAEASLGSTKSAAPSAKPGEKPEFVALFQKDGIPEGWLVRNWDDVKNSPATNVHWQVENGVLHGSEPRGTWLLSEREYGDFVLEFEWRLGERGNSGTALRAPLFGDPAF